MQNSKLRRRSLSKIRTFRQRNRMSAESPRHVRSGGPLLIPSQPPSDRGIIDAVSGFINDVTLSSSSTVDPKDVIQWARFETADINEPTPEGDGDNDIKPLLLVLGYGSGVQVWLIPPNGEAQEVLSWRQGTVRVLRILPTPQHGDCFASKRPLIALCDSASPGPAFCSLSFISIRGGEQVKSIKFKNPILDVLANKRSVVVSFSERFAVFDAGTLEDRMSITTCYPCPCPLGGTSPVNPISLGDRWLAYADKKLNPSKRSSGGCESEGVTSYTATVLHAAKSLSKGLRGLGETVAHSLAGGRSTSQSPSPPHADQQQPGVVTVLDIESNEDEDCQDCEEPCDPIVAHFVAHSEAIIALKFDPSGMLLVTADRRGHDFHVFRINPHPCGPNLASVHHLYVLHRGDTTAKVQDIAVSGDGRWAAVSTLRGTTHVFAISAYGGAVGVRTHTQTRVVNRLSRFHRSAGLPIHAAPAHHSPSDGVGVGVGVGVGAGAGSWFPNPRLPPYPHPTTCAPLAQLRPHKIPTHTITRTSSGRQRLSSLSEENGAAPLLARARFGPCTSTQARAVVVPLYLMAAGGALLHLMLQPRAARGLPKEKVCDDSSIEVDVEPVCQWQLQRPAAAADLLAPLPPTSPLLQPPSCWQKGSDMCMSEEERWLSQVEIVTHAGPHRRLWMGPQFVFKTYNCTGSSSSLSEAESVEVEASTARSTPVNVPAARPRRAVLVGDGSASSLEHSPSDSFRRKSLLAETGRTASVCDVQLREDLAEAMKEDHGLARVERSARGVDPDRHTRANTDEAAFRGVRGAALAGSPELHAHPLPHTTTIPAQPAAPLRVSPDDDPQPLTTDVVIPAELTSVGDWLPTNIDADDSSLENSIVDDSWRSHISMEDVTLQRERKASNIVNLDRSNLDDKIDVNKIVLNEEKYVTKNDSVRERVSTKVETERENNDLSLPKESQSSADIQPIARARIKKSPTTKRISDNKIASDVNVKEKQSLDRNEREDKIRKEKTSTDAGPSSTTTDTYSNGIKRNKENLKNISGKTNQIQEITAIKSDFSDRQYRSTKTYEEKLQHKPEIKTEEQAWDMLLTEPVKSKGAVDPPPLVNENKIDIKTKPKKNRKINKRNQGDQITKTDEDDSFVEILTIENKQPANENIVSISNAVECTESTASYLSRSCKPRPSKSRTPEQRDSVPDAAEIFTELESYESMYNKLQTDTNCTVDFKQPERYRTISKPNEITNQIKDTLSINTISDVSYSNNDQCSSIDTKEFNISTNNQTSSPQKNISDSNEKEVYVINTTEDDFPEIQITKTKKSRKRSPQLPDRKSQESSIVKPVKSWSSIAAAKSKKSDEDVEIAAAGVCFMSVEEVPKKEVSLQDKLIELCKRRDVIVAECDAPSELNFVEEHHSMLHDLPPLEPLDFGLNDFKLEVMRDSLLDVNETKLNSPICKITSPICKINIDDILSSLKEGSSKAIESSTYNLIDLEKVKSKKEKGFSVVETDKITSQEVRLDDEGKLDKDIEVEKSSDDDLIPGLSADVPAPLPSKQGKVKKLRKKKK